MKPDPKRLSAYGMIKRTSVMNTLPVEEIEELERLERRKRISPASEARLAELWDKAFDLHSARQAVREREATDWEQELADLNRRLREARREAP
jgi:hypothetical protein